jgi:adenylate cyclase
MGEDEAGTIAIMKAHRTELLEPLCKKHGGRVVKFMGDGVLVEFASVVEAVLFAIEMQKALVETKGPIELRIGINLGDIIVDDEDVFGDGVNVAARLEAKAAANGVCVSDMVYQSVQSKLDVQFGDMGELDLKNIQRPIRAWHWTASTETAFTSSPGKPKTGVKPSIAVLPFNNMSGDPDQEFFSDGISEDIITELSRSRALLVVARNSSFQFRGAAVDISAVGESLKVGYVLEGSVRKSGERIRVTAQLIDASDNTHIWAERYDGTIEDIFELQDEITRSIVTTIAGRIEDVQSDRLAERPTQSLSAYEHVLRGQKWMQQYSEQAYAKARESFEAAVRIDPEFARAHAGVSLAAFYEWNGANEPGLMQLARDSAANALRIDPHESRCHLALGTVHMFAKEHDKAEYHLSKAMELNPNDDQIMVELGRLRMYLGRPLEGADLVRLAMRRNPYGPNWYWNILGRCFHTAKMYEEAIAAFERIDTPQFFNHAYLAGCHHALGHAEVAQRHHEQLLAMNPGFTLTEFAGQLPYRNRTDLEDFLLNLREAGIPD